MKNLYLRSSLALVCALGLAACGGDDGDLMIVVSVSGIPQAGLVLQNKGGSDLAVGGVGTYYFERIGNDAEYDITIKAGTIPANYECVVHNGKGKTGAYSVQDVAVVCNLIPQNLTGDVKNLTTTGLVVVNGSNRIEIPSGATKFSMTTLVLDSTGKIVLGSLGQVGRTMPYGLAILSQPNGQTCTLSNGTGVVGTTDVTNILIQC